MDKYEILTKRVDITVVLRGTENEIDIMIARFAALSTSEEVRSLHIKELTKLTEREKQRVRTLRGYGWSYHMIAQDTLEGRCGDLINEIEDFIREIEKVGEEK